MIETIVTIAIILGAGVWLFLWARRAAKGDGGCSCGACAKSCPAKDLKSSEPVQE